MCPSNRTQWTTPLKTVLAEIFHLRPQSSRVYDAGPTSNLHWFHKLALVSCLSCSVLVLFSKRQTDIEPLEDKCENYMNKLKST